MATTILTVRVERELLETLKKKVRREGTTVSATVVRLLRTEIGPPRARRAPRRTAGMFEGQFADLDLAELRRGRTAASARLAAAKRRSRP